MNEYTYLILGGGMAAAAAVQGIREIDQRGTIGLLSTDRNPPYKRPPLSKKLWAGKSENTIWLPLENANVTLHLGRAAKQILREKRQVIDDQGGVYQYQALLIALGGTPRRLAWDQGDDIIYYRTFADYQRLRQLTGTGKRFAVIGGGFIGSELAAALRTNDKEVSMVFPGQGLGERIFGAELSQFLNDYYRHKGVEVLAGDKPTAVKRQADGLILTTEQGRELAVDGIVAGLGIVPNTELAHLAGLEIDDGISVDEHLRTSDPHIYAAGDVVSFFSPQLKTRRRVEHEDNATSMGRSAGRNMAGTQERYEHLPFFYSDLFDLGYEAVGEIDARHQMVLDWKEPFRKGVIYYLHEQRVRGVLLWNVWEQVEAARALIQQQQPVTPQQLQGRLPERNG